MRTSSTRFSGWLGDAFKRGLRGFRLVAPEIGQRDHTDEALVAVDHRRPTDLALGHAIGGFLHVVLLEAVVDRSNITSRTVVAAGLRSSATAHMAMSRSVTMPISLSFSTTGSAPISSARIFLAASAVACGRIGDQGLEDLQVIFRQKPKVDGPNHWGCRLVFARDGTLFVTLGERFRSGAGSLHPSRQNRAHQHRRLGAAFAGRKDALPEIWCYGHRNIGGAAIHPETDVLWAHEMGPKVGDELNIP